MNITTDNEWKIVNYGSTEITFIRKYAKTNLSTNVNIHIDIQFRTKCSVAEYGNKFVSLMVQVNGVL